MKKLLIGLLAVITLSAMGGVPSTVENTFLITSTSKKKNQVTRALNELGLTKVKHLKNAKYIVETFKIHTIKTGPYSGIYCGMDWTFGMHPKFKRIIIKDVKSNEIVFNERVCKKSWSSLFEKVVMYFNP